MNMQNMGGRRGGVSAERSFILTALVLTLCVAVLAGCSEDPEKKARHDAAMKEIRMNRMAREFVSGHLRDPGSAEFRNQKEFCGEVNSRNALGGYVGHQRFIAGSAELVVFERDSGLSRNEFEELWDQMCM